MFSGTQDSRRCQRYRAFLTIMVFFAPGGSARVLSLNLTLPHSGHFQLVPTTATENNAKAFCNSSTTWLGDETDFEQFRSDCVKAEESLFQIEIEPPFGGVDEYEFLPAPAKPIHNLPVRRTPRRYTYSECKFCNEASFDAKISNMRSIISRFLYFGSYQFQRRARPIPSPGLQKAFA